VTTTDVPFDLAEVKLVEPLIRPGTVAKPGLIAGLSHASVPVTTIVAPAGYGKTTLLARWAEADPRPFAWVALDAGDDDAVVFLRYVAAAMHRLEPMPEQAFEALAGPGGSAWTSRLPRVGTALAAQKRSIVLVLDDLHAVSNQSCLDALAELVEYIPPGSQIVIASREEPALPIARWRARGQLLEVGVPELRMDERETGELLKASGVELEPNELRDLTARTEGWPAGIYLAALSIQAGAPSSIGPGASGDDRFVSEYLHLELLARLPEADAQFLMRTSVLDRMSGGLCDAVLQTTGSAGRLEALWRTNGFVLPLDRRGEWYRYHHLFGQLLRTELERSEPDLVAELNRRALSWCVANELPEAAVAYAHAAGETDAVAGMIDALALPTYYDGRKETLEEWLGWFAERDLARYPALAVYAAWLAALAAQPAEAERLLAIADGATSSIPLSDGSATVEPWVAALRAHMMPRGIDQALDDASLALRDLAKDSIFVPTTLVARGVAHALRGETSLAMADLTEVLQRAPTLDAIEESVLAEAQLALLAARGADWSEAQQRAQGAIGLIERNGLDDYTSSALAYAAAARVAHHEGRLVDARAALTRAHRLRPMLDHSIPWVTIEVGLELTRVHLALTDVAAARTILGETERVLELRPKMGFPVDDARELRDQLSATSGPLGAWAMSLTAAELRLLPYLATHLTIPEIATRLFLSRNTVKTEAVSVYRKLTASSRSEAIARAIEVGLLEASIYPRALDSQR